MGPPSILVSATFTRPNDTNAYTAGDLVANDTDAGDVAMMSWRIPPRGMWLRQVKITKSDPDITNAGFRLWLHSDSAVTFTNGENGALAISSSTLSIAEFAMFGAIIDVTVDKTLTGAGDVGYSSVFDAGAHYLGGPAAGPTTPGYTTIYGFLSATAAYTPGALEVFTVYLRGDPYI